MKKITFENKEYFYKIYWKSTHKGYTRLDPFTEFYTNFITEPAWTFFNWESKDIVEIPKNKVFEVPINIEDEKYSKEDILKYIKIGFYRKQEIENGEII